MHIENIKRFDSSEGNVWKYVFDFGTAVAEAVLYKYENFYKRTVLCVSVQSGCPVGCTFCSTGLMVKKLMKEDMMENAEILMNSILFVN